MPSAIDTIVRFRRLAKNWFSALFLYKVTGIAKVKMKKSGDVITLKKGGLSPRTLISVIRQGWVPSQMQDEYLFRKEDIELIQPNAGALIEPLESNYLLEDIAGQTVADIGGYLGETAVMFLKLGHAKKVIVFEPVYEHYKFILKNAEINKIPADKIEVYNVGIDKKRREKEVQSPVYSLGFGLQTSRKYKKVHIALWSWNKVLKILVKNRSYLAKDDCEGCEHYLTSVPCSGINKIPNWIIEAHSQEIRKNLMNVGTV